MGYQVVHGREVGRRGVSGSSPSIPRDTAHVARDRGTESRGQAHMAMGVGPWSLIAPQRSGLPPVISGKARGCSRLSWPTCEGTDRSVSEGFGCHRQVTTLHVRDICSLPLTPLWNTGGITSLVRLSVVSAATEFIQRSSHRQGLTFVRGVAPHPFVCSLLCW